MQWLSSLHFVAVQCIAAEVVKVPFLRGQIFIVT